MGFIFGYSFLFPFQLVDMGKVLAGLQVPAEDNEEFSKYLSNLNYHWVEETNNPLYKQFFC